MDHRRHCILIVDDTSLNNKIMRDILIDKYEVLVATSGEEALSIAISEKVDLILLDVIMPGMDGYETCRKLKDDPKTRNIPVIFVSAANNERDEIKGLEIGAIDYIIKPSSPAIINARVKNHLELKKYRDILEQLSLIDGLTGIANRRHFDETLEKEWRLALANDNMISLILLDIDFFKKFNDHYGHLVGDDCLRKVVKVLIEALKRDGDFLARYGGEEFAVILPSTSMEKAWNISERLRTNVESLKIAHQESKVSEYVTVSIGVATIKANGNMAPDRLIEKADYALYQAKHEGRNRVVIANVFEEMS